MSDVSTPGTSPVADRPVKVCAGIEGRPCGKEIPAIRTWCEECSAERRKLKRSGYNSNYYQANQESLVEKQRERNGMVREREECEIVIKMAAWIKREMDRKRDLEFGYDRPPTPASYPKAYQRLRPARRERIFARADDLVMQELRRGIERMNQHGRTLKHFSYRPPRLRDILPEPEPAAATVADGRNKTRIHSNKSRRRKKRGRPRLTEAEQLERRWRRASSLYTRVVLEEMQPHEAWYAVNPQSKMSRETATREARREITWLRRNYPPTMEERLHLTGLADLDGISRAVKTALEANLPARGKQPARPDWEARMRALILLQRGLGLATWRGLRSGPHAEGGELEDVPVARNDVPAGDEDAGADIKQRIKAQGIFFRHNIEGKSLADCWYEVNPQSKANRITAKKEAAKLADHFQKRYASSLSERLIANGLDEQVVIAKIKELKEAGRGDGQWRLLSKGLDMQMVILGLRPPSGKSVSRRAVEATKGDVVVMDRLYGLDTVDHETEELPPPSPEGTRRVYVADLYLMHFGRGLSLADAWYELHLETKDRITEEAAANAAECELMWFRQAYPMPMATLMEAHDLGIHNLIEGTKELVEATKKLKVGTTWVRDERGRVISKTADYIDVPNDRAQISGLDKLVTLRGCGPGGWRGPAVASSEQGTGDDEPRTLPKTIEEAKARGIPITLIEHPEDLSPEEWQRQWAAYQEEKERLQANGRFSAEWLARLMRDLD